MKAEDLELAGLGLELTTINSEETKQIIDGLTMKIKEEGKRWENAKRDSQEKASQFFISRRIKYDFQRLGTLFIAGSASGHLPPIILEA